MNVTSRAEWSAKPASLPKNLMRLPASEVWLHHTVTPVTDKPFKDMRVVEAVGLSRFRQFSYSYCVHPDGTIMEGCGDRVGAHTAGRNSTSFGVALIGNYDERSLTVWQIDAVRWLIAELVRTGKLRRGVYPTGGHRDLKPTACPGAKAYRLLDVMRVPWTIANQEVPMADNPDLPNIEGPLEIHLLQDQAGNCTGYAIFSVSTGELHGFGPGWKYYGRSEDLTPT